jgi:hypothetical protein
MKPGLSVASRNAVLVLVGRAVPSPPPSRSTGTSPTARWEHHALPNQRRALAVSLGIGLLSSILSLPSATAETNAVTRGLAWLAAQQQASGAWSTNTALNALPLLAFMSAGCTPDARTPQAAVVDRGFRFLLAQQATNGAFTAGGGLMYGHGLATLALAEVSGMSARATKARTALERAGQLILRSQAVEKGNFHTGGWRYFPDSTDSDLSVTVWQITALKAASEVGIAVPRDAMQRAAAYVQRCAHPTGGFGYQPGGIPNQSRTAAGILALQLSGAWNDPLIPRARRWLRDNPLTWESEYFYYAAHHCAHAGAGFDEQLLRARQNADGSWPFAPTTRDELRAGPLYTTSLAVLALTAKWDYLPVYLR